jgi:hypothetical protein
MQAYRQGYIEQSIHPGQNRRVPALHDPGADDIGPDRSAKSLSIYPVIVLEVGRLGEKHEFIFVLQRMDCSDDLILKPLGCCLTHYPMDVPYPDGDGLSRGAPDAFGKQGLCTLFQGGRIQSEGGIR